jgi:hypothetical protein
MKKRNRHIAPGRNPGDPDRGDPGGSLRENRWCERHGYFIDRSACEARAKTRRACARCIARWLQLSFPFMAS